MIEVVLWCFYYLWFHSSAFLNFTSSSTNKRETPLRHLLFFQIWGQRTRRFTRFFSYLKQLFKDIILFCSVLDHFPIYMLIVLLGVLTGSTSFDSILLDFSFNIYKQCHAQGFVRGLYFLRR